MNENSRNTGINLAKMMLIAVFIVAIFIAGFLSGGSFLYSISSSEITFLNLINLGQRL